jgi:uncharacterized damage-inducible protein DinB
MDREPADFLDPEWVDLRQEFQEGDKLWSRPPPPPSHSAKPQRWSPESMTTSPPASDHLGLLFVEAAINALEANRRLAERAVAQLPDEKLHVPLDGNTNSIAVIMKHIAGNLLSRWTDFLTTDGEKPWRNRDAEFVNSFTSRDELEAYWERGWACLLEALKSLSADDLTRTVSIRGEPHSAPLAIQRSLGHTCYHVGQIVQVARILAGDKWETLTIPRGGSEQFNRQHWGQSGRSHS